MNPNATNLETGKKHARAHTHTAKKKYEKCNEKKNASRRSICAINE